jgi:hypothetical protein
MTPRRSRSLFDLALEDVERRIDFLQQERAHLLRLQAAHLTRPTKPTAAVAKPAPKLERLEMK